MITRTVTVAGQYLAATFLIVMGLIASGCGDSATVNPVVELASLTVDPGTLQPGFSGGRDQYRVDVTTDITTVTVTAQPAVAGDTVTINGQPTTSRPITLEPPGETTIVNIVVSETDTNSRTYVIRLVRAGLAGNNSLQNLTVSPGTLAPAFDANLQTYTVNVANNVTSIAVTPTLQDPAATMTVDGQPTGSGQARTVNLNATDLSTLITIIVTSQNGTPKNYQVTVSRGRSNNNNLQSLNVSPGTLSPAFRAGTTGYTVNLSASLPSNVTGVRVTPILQDPNATMTVNGQALPSGQALTTPLPAPGSNTFINIVVVAQDGTAKPYSVNVIRAALGGNNNLSGLTVTQGTLSPAFNANTTSYTVNVASGVTSVAVTPTRQDSNATITVNGQSAPSGQARTITLNGAGSNTLINIVVTAPNSSQRTYTVNVARAALGGNNNLSALTVSPGPLDSPFNANDLSYTVNVASGVTSVAVTPTRQDSNATITVNGQSAPSGQARTITLNGAGSNTLINIAVTAPNGTQKTYSVNVIRAALGGNNNLSGLTVTQGTLSPAFNANRTSYTVDVGSGVTSVTVDATLQASTASMTVNGQATPSSQARTITLNGAGSTTSISIVVTAPNGTQKTYTVNVTRAALGGNNNLQNLTVSPGTLNPAFTAGRTLPYAVNDVSSSATAILVTATPQDSSASMTINGQGGNSRSIPLPGGPNSTEIDVRVIAPNGNARTYSITVNQPAPGEQPAPTVAPDLIPEDDSCARDSANACVPPTSDADNITNVSAPRFRIAQPAAGQTADLYVDGNKVNSQLAANTLRPTPPLSDGDHTITYTVTSAGLESDQSPSLTVTIDTAPPPPPGEDGAD